MTIYQGYNVSVPSPPHACTPVVLTLSWIDQLANCLRLMSESESEPVDFGVSPTFLNYYIEYSRYHGTSTA
jgi:hypothetical protein